MKKTLIAAAATAAFLGGAALALVTELDETTIAKIDAYEEGCKENTASQVNCTCVADEMKKAPEQVDAVIEIVDETTFFAAPAEAQAIIVACLNG